MARYVVALDEGTTSVRTVLFDEQGTMVSMVQHEFRQIYPKPGYVEQDPMEIYANQYSSLIECIAQNNISAEDIAAIGITNQRETTVVWDKKTGTPIYNAIVWQCRRTAPICDQLIEEGYEEYIAKTTGLKIDAYFSGTKIKWILDNVEGAREKAEKGELLFGTIDTWLVWKLTNGAVHVTDLTNASRTMLFDIEKRQWDPKMLEILNIPACMLPEVRSSSEVYAYLDLMGVKVPIAGIAGDQQSALFGQACFHRGQMKSTYGTGVFLLANTGSEMVRSKNGLVTTLAATRKGYPVEYALEGSVFVGGAVIQWIRDELMLIHDSKDSEYFAKKVKDTAGVYIVPAFSGLGAPYWDMEARGTIVGLTRGSNRNHIIRAALESIAYQTADITRAMEQDLNMKIDTLKVDGGASANAFLMQFQADLLGCRIFRAQMQEATAFGAAALAGLAVGFFKSRTNLEELNNKGTIYTNSMEKEQVQQLTEGWHKAIRACRTK